MPAQEFIDFQVRVREGNTLYSDRWEAYCLHKKCPYKTGWRGSPGFAKNAYRMHWKARHGSTFL